jgi:circadian clock protein KaiB
MSDDAPASNRQVLRLYVAGHTPNAIRAISNLRSLAEVHLHGNCEIEVIDLLREPVRAIDDDIVATPTLVRKAPLPERRLIGNLGDSARILELLGITAEES